MSSREALRKLEQRHLRRQQKKDAKFEVLMREKVELTDEEMRKKRDRDYLESMFPDLKGGF